jgi:hypothetical protein
LDFGAENFYAQGFYLLALAFQNVEAAEFHLELSAQRREVAEEIPGGSAVSNHGCLGD